MILFDKYFNKSNRDSYISEYITSKGLLIDKLPINSKNVTNVGFMRLFEPSIHLSPLYYTFANSTVLIVAFFIFYISRMLSVAPLFAYLIVNAIMMYRVYYLMNHIR